MSMDLMTQVWKTDLPSTTKFVLLALCDNSSDGGECWPSIDRIAMKCSLSVRSVQRALGELEDAGYCKRHFRSNRSTMYYIADPGKWPTASPQDVVGGVTQSHPRQAVTGDTVSPQGCQPDTSGVTHSHLRGDTVSPRTIRGTISGTQRGTAAPTGNLKPHMLASAAWAEVMAAIRRGEKPAAWSHELTDPVLREIGGFSLLGAQPERELSFTGNDFKAIFKLRAMSVSPAKGVAQEAAA
jgi:hypothetical protein